MTSTNLILTVILRLQSNLQFPNKMRPTYDCVLCSCVSFSNPQFCFTLQDIPKNSIVIIIVDAVIHMSRNGYYSKISKKKKGTICHYSTHVQKDIITWPVIEKVQCYLKLITWRACLEAAYAAT